MPHSSCITSVFTTILTLLLTLNVTSCSETPRSVARHPYLQLATPHSMVIRWGSVEKSADIVIYGKDKNKLEFTASSEKLRIDHEVKLENLEPGTLYYYQVGSNEEKIFSFRTPPKTGEKKPVTIWVLGDSGKADQSARDVRDNYLKNFSNTPPDVWLMLGDNAYNKGSDNEIQNAIFNVYTDILPATALWSAFGNHDRDTKKGDPYFSMLTLPEHGDAGGYPSNTESYYSFDYANIHFISLNTSTEDLTTDGDMYEWMIKDLKQDKQDWRIVFFHHSPYSKGNHDSDFDRRSIELRKNYIAAFDQYNVDLVLSGHTHLYERTYPIVGHTGTSNTFNKNMITLQPDNEGKENYKKRYHTANQGVIYSVIGSSSQVAPNGSMDHPAFIAKHRALGSVVIQVNNNRLDYRFISPVENIGDSYSITKF